MKGLVLFFVLCFCLPSINVAKAEPNIRFHFGDTTKKSTRGKSLRVMVLASPAGTPIIAAAPGIVGKVKQYRGNDGDWSVVIRHTVSGSGCYGFACEYFTVYGRLASPRVKVGDTVRRGEVIGVLAPTANRRKNPELYFGLNTVGYETPPGDLGNGEHYLNPRDFTVGCYTLGEFYAMTPLTLTWPVRCSDTITPTTPAKSLKEKDPPSTDEFEATRNEGA